MVVSVMEGASRQEVSEMLDTAKSTVVKIVQQFNETGSVEPKPVGGSVSPLEKHGHLIDQAFKDKPDSTLKEVVKYLKSFNVITSTTSVWRYLKRHGKSYKQKTVYAAQQLREDVVKARSLWSRNQKTLEAKTLIFIDETGVKKGMRRTHGWCDIGKRLVDYVNLGYRKNHTFIAGLALDGIVAPMMFEGAMNGERFLEYIEGCLAPSLKRGDVVVMDNLPVHYVDGVEDAIQKVGASVLFLPPYSPDLNPIEHFFSKIKATLRKASKETIPEMISVIRKAIRGMTANECANLFESCGYGRM